MSEAVIVSTARTPIGKAYRGAFNNTSPVTLASHAIKHAVDRAKVDPAEIEDVWMGCGFPEGAQGQNIARHASIGAGIKKVNLYHSIVLDIGMPICEF